MDGIVEIFGTSPKFGGFIVGGWIDLTWNTPPELPPITLSFSDGEQIAPAYICIYTRADIKKLGYGFVLIAEAGNVSSGRLLEVRIRCGTRTYKIPASDDAREYNDAQFTSHLSHFLKYAPPNIERARMTALLEKPHYNGADTFSALAWPTFIHVDKIYLCPPSGLLLRGWMLDPFQRVAKIRVVCGSVSRPIDKNTWIRVKRKDVVDSFADRFEIQNNYCGFIAFVSNLYRFEFPLYLEAEMIDGAVAYMPLARPYMTGKSSIVEILGLFEADLATTNNVYDAIIGPAIESININRLMSRPEISTKVYGQTAQRPKASIIIPLYGRIDFVEYQIASFSDTLFRDHEIIYVLDDPSKRREATELAETTYEKLRRPFKLIAISENLGFAPANNIGLEAARGEYICFLNSDVFPKRPDWLESMIATLEDVPNIGVVGAHLLYEDDTVQHDGCSFERLPQFGNWPFPMHPGKGLHSTGFEGRSVQPMVTGACMLLKADVAREIGGFDEGYIIGDFEDADLCFQLADRGLKSVVDRNAVLYHLERQSQALQPGLWRMNLTLYNAWRFQAKWGHRVD